MGRKGSKKFIEKGESQKFHLLHRSQRDAAYANEENPSDFVLVPAEQFTNGQRTSNNNNAMRNVATKGCHINELGFANDGYDYSQHLKEATAGEFIPRAGVTLDFETLNRQIDLPEDALPSRGAEMERNLEAITISHDLMDADIRAALFDDADEEGLPFEELNDDFVMDAMNAPAEPDFDFDAHIARLIAQSERSLGIRSKREEESLKYSADDRRMGIIDEDEEFDSDDEFPEHLIADMMNDGHADNQISKHEKRSKNDKAVAPLSEERRAIMEAQFDDLLEEYADQEIGYLSEADGAELEGSIDLNDADEDLDESISSHSDIDEDDIADLEDIKKLHMSRNANGSVQSRSVSSRSEHQINSAAVLNEAMDEFLQEQKDNLFAEGVNIPKGMRSVPAIADHDTQQIDIKTAYTEQLQLQQESTLEVMELERQAEQLRISKDIETCQEYLREERQEEQWDCETILSTYSTLDNHPTLIKAPGSKFRPYKSRHARKLEEASSSGSISNRSATNSAISANQLKSGSDKRNPDATPQIVLTGKLGLPEGFGPAQYELKNEKRRERKQRQEQLRKQRIGTINEGNEDNVEGSDNEQDPTHDQERDTSFIERRSIEFEDDLQTELTNTTVGRNKYETAEQKRLRKAIAKEEKRQRRDTKREVKNLYKNEGAKIGKCIGKEQSLEHVSVFKYT